MFHRHSKNYLHYLKELPVQQPIKSNLCLLFSAFLLNIPYLMPNRIFVLFQVCPHFSIRTSTYSLIDNTFISTRTVVYYDTEIMNSCNL